MQKVLKAILIYFLFIIFLESKIKLKKKKRKHLPIANLCNDRYHQERNIT